MSMTEQDINRGVNKQGQDDKKPISIVGVRQARVAEIRETVRNLGIESDRVGRRGFSH